MVTGYRGRRAWSKMGTVDAGDLYASKRLVRRRDEANLVSGYYLQVPVRMLTPVVAVTSTDNRWHDIKDLRRMTLESRCHVLFCERYVTFHEPVLAFGNISALHATSGRFT